MTCAISCAGGAESTWVVQSSVFTWFADRVAERCPKEHDLLHQLEMAVVTNGVSLEVLYAQNPKLANRLKDAFRELASEIAEGKYDAAAASVFGASQVGWCRDVFEELATLMSKCVLE